MKAKIVSQIKSAEKVMSAGRIKTGVIDDMGSISKIAASIYYQAASPVSYTHLTLPTKRIV